MTMRGLAFRRGTLLMVSFCCMLLLFGGAVTAHGDADTAGHTKVGDKMPAISVQEISGSTFSLAREHGKVVVVNFWATWCPPCQVEMPRLEKEIWEKYKSRPDFAMVAIAREQSKETVAEFQKKHSAYTFPLAFDPHRAVYKLFADSGIPRTYVVGRDGKIAFQSLGYEPGDIGALDKAIQKALAAR
jgi:peroxiredoxin